MTDSPMLDAIQYVGLLFLVILLVGAFAGAVWDWAVARYIILRAKRRFRRAITQQAERAQQSAPVVPITQGRRQKDENYRRPNGAA